MFSSKSSTWVSPQILFNAVNDICNFKTDVCATVENAKCAHFYSPKEDGLKQTWTGMCWMNPPYGRGISPWTEKAHLESRKPNTIVVSLLPSRTDTAWWHDYVIGEPVLYFRGRLKFSGHKNAAPFPSALALLGGNIGLMKKIQLHLTANGMPCASQWGIG